MEEDLNSHRKSNLVFLFFLATSIFFMTARLNDYVSGFKKFVFYLVSPVPITSSEVINSSKRFSSNIKELVRAHQDNISLREKLEKYASLENEFIRSKEENIRLRTLFDFIPALKRKTIVARVISREPNSWFQWIIIDKGKKNGIFIDAPVLALVNNGFCVLGRIGEVFENSSKVILITNALSALPAMINTTEHDGLIEGQNNLYIRLNYIVKDENIKAGDSIFTSPLSSVFPPNVLIGRVMEVVPSEDERFRSVLVKSEVDFNNLREVVVMVSE